MLITAKKWLSRHRKWLLIITGILLIGTAVINSFPVYIHNHDKATKNSEIELLALEKSLGWTPDHITESAICAPGNGGTDPSPWSVICEYRQIRTYGLDGDLREKIALLQAKVHANNWEVTEYNDTHSQQVDPFDKWLKDYDKNYGIPFYNGDTLQTASDLEYPSEGDLIKEVSGLKKPLRLNIVSNEKDPAGDDYFELLESQISRPETSSVVSNKKWQKNYLTADDVSKIYQKHKYIFQLVVANTYYSK